MWLSSLFVLIPFLSQLFVAAIMPPQTVASSTEVLDRRGERIGYIGFRPGIIPYALEDIPAQQKELVLLAEDRRFYKHSGIDFLRLASVVLKGTPGGASTITQQWVRMRAGLERHWWNKPIVMALAVLLESRVSKEVILEAYLNHVPYSHNVHGLGAASEFYFSKPLQALSPGEAATLATMIHSPSALSRDRAQKVLLQKRNKLLGLWRSESSVLAQNEPLKLAKNFPQTVAPHYLMRLPKNNEKVLKTTLDLVLQKDLEKILAEEIHRLSKRGVRHGALLVLSAHSGDVLAYLGSADFFNPDGGQVDGLQVRRQPGSTLKAFTYALAADDGMSAADILADTPGVFRSGLGVYRPRNYDENFTGPRRAREALANSLNLPAIMLLDELTPARLHQTLMELGVELPRESDFYGVGLTLGNAEISPYTLAQAFSVFPRQGSWVKARNLQREKILTHESKLKPSSLWLITDILKDRLARMEAFGERTVFDVPFEMAAKTGTSTDYRDNWTVAWTSEHIVIAWVGNHDQRPMQRVSGITGAGPLARATMLRLYDHSMPAPFTAPVAYFVRPVCTLSGMAPGPHCKHVIDEKFTTPPSEELCNWHVEIATTCGPQKVIKYPERFSAWAYDRGLDVESQVKNICQQEDVKIAHTVDENATKVTYPLNGSVFAIDPDLPRDRQRLPMRMSGSVKNVEWEIDGERFKPETSDGTLDWMLEKGKHTVRLIKADASQDEISIFVR